MVRALHRVGIEVILDVVYNHSAEGDRFGPTLAFRGIDNRVYYRLDPSDPATYVNLTGCGNTLDLRQPRVLALVVDSLRYWVETMHVDGFRFDLAPALARDGDGFDPGAPLFAAVRADPVLADVKLIAEPWDATAEGYALGRYPAPWREWNGRYRDDVRRWWRGEAGRVGATASRLAGSPELYASSGRGPTASIDFVTAHDGFSLRDLVSYDRKHNEANREDNRDGADDNLSWNCGVEGPSDDAAVNGLRARQQRNFLATLFLSQGVPMLRAGDELGATQQGNNNAYCQDNALTWLDWNLDTERAALLAFTRRMTALVRRHPGLRRVEYLAGALVAAEPGGDLVWYAPSGRPMRDADWHDHERRVLGMWLAEVRLLVLLNASPDALLFTLPVDAPPGGWTPLVDTARPDVPPRAIAGGAYDLVARSAAVLTPCASNAC